MSNENQHNQSHLSDGSPFPNYDDPREFPDLSPAQQAQMDHLMDTQGLSAYEARLRALGQPIVGESDVELGLPDEDTETLPEIERLERFETVKQQHGFYPASLRELSEVTTIDAFSEKQWGVSKHLGEIAQHQIKHGYDPDASAQSVVTEYARFAHNARSEATRLMQLAAELAEVDAHTFSTLNPDHAVTAPGLLVRFLDWEDFARGDHESDELYPLVRYTDNVALDPREFGRQNPSRPMRDYIDSRLSSLRLDQARKSTQRAIQDRQAALSYWQTQLEGIQQYSTGPARVIAASELDKLHVN